MSDVPFGITAETINTGRLGTRVLSAGDSAGEVVLFLHGNVSSATWWEPVLALLPGRYRAIAPDLRGYGDADITAHLDATRGMADHVDDLIALVDHLEVDRFHVVGSSLGGVVVWSMMAEIPERLITVTQVAPGSPYGFGATKGVDGEPVTDDYAGSGGGLINPEFVERLARGDRSTDSPLSPLSAMRLLTAHSVDPDVEERLLGALLATHTGDNDYPGDVAPSPDWPFVAPGVWGSTNALSPKYLRELADSVLAGSHKPPVLWIRGAQDVAVSDSAAGDPGTWGPMGLVPGYPGAEVYPPQPMLAQTRAFLERYRDAGGAFDEVVLEDCGHIPYAEMPGEFTALMREHLAKKPTHEEEKQ